MAQPPPSVDELARPGPIRAAALGAAAGSLLMDLGVCGDRARFAAQRAVDAAINAAQEVANGNR